MKKIWKEVNRRVYVYWFMGVSILITSLVFWVGVYSWWEAAIYGFIFFILFTGMEYINHVEAEKRTKYNEDTFGADPEWEKYKELKKKFPK